MEYQIKSKIAELRKKTGLTQLELSQLVGVTENTVQNWESGRAGLDQIDRVIRFCKALNCQVEDLIEYLPDAELSNKASLSDLRQMIKTDKSPIQSKIPAPRRRKKAVQ